MADYNPHQSKDAYEEKLIQVSRVSKKTKGGNSFGFSVVMVVGDKKGKIGVGKGKASDVVSAIRKGVKKAKKKMIQVPIDGTTVPFRISVKKGASKLILKPAPKGTGVIAGGPVRAVVEAAGIRDISSKILGTTNKASNAYATFEALRQIAVLVKIKGIKLRSIAKVEEVEKKKIAQEQEKAKKKTEVKKPVAKKTVKAKVKPETKPKAVKAKRVTQKVAPAKKK